MQVAYHLYIYYFVCLFVFFCVLFIVFFSHYGGECCFRPARMRAVAITRNPGATFTQYTHTHTHTHTHAHTHTQTHLLRGHDTVHLFQLERQPLLLRKLVLLQRDGQLLVVFYCVLIKLVQGAVGIKFGRV